MPKAKVGNIELYYELHGQGPAVLMIQGLGFSSKFWARQIPALAPHFQVVVFDNRGAGQSDKPKEPYTIGLMAQDAVGLLDHLGIAKAHVIGASMGGYIAQVLAVNHPERVEKLVLMCTHFGGPEYLAATAELWKEILSVRALTLAQMHRHGLKYSLSEEFFHTRPQEVEELVKMRVAETPPPHAFQGQFSAASQFDFRGAVGQIRAPTLVLAGVEDRIVPLKFVQKLAQSIPGAKFEAIAGAGHLLFWEKAEEVNQEILHFLQGG